MTARRRFLWVIIGFLIAIALTIISVWLIQLDASWHVSQMLQESNLVTVLDPVSSKTWILFLIMSYWNEFEHFILGQSMSSYMLWFIGFLALGIFLNNLIDYIDKKTMWERKVLALSLLFVIGSSIATAYIIVFIIKDDTSFHLGSIVLQLSIAQLLDPNFIAFIQRYLLVLVLSRWDLFEHSQGQSASSYVIYFLIALAIYIVIILIIGWYIRRKEYYIREKEIQEILEKKKE